MGPTGDQLYGIAHVKVHFKKYMSYPLQKGFSELHVSSDVKSIF